MVQTPMILPHKSERVKGEGDEPIRLTIVSVIDDSFKAADMIIVYISIASDQ